jgi:hypothetical protein
MSATLQTRSPPLSSPGVAVTGQKPVLTSSSRVYAARNWASSADVNDFARRTSSELDLRERDAVYGFLRQIRPDVAFLAAARMGGTLANSPYAANFLSHDLRIR